MLSGNGRHRRPRQAPALIVAAGVAGSAIAIPLLGATGASAASGTTWDAVAECESGGSWSADQGNGRFGGLQMTQETWESHGGLDYAPSADQASRSQQIAVAEKVLADEGTSAWLTCGLVAGLTQDSDSADVDTGLAEGTGDASSDSAGSSGSKGDDGAKSDDTDSGSDSADDSGSGSHGLDGSAGGGTSKSDDSGKSTPKAEASAEAEDESASGRHRGTADEVDTAPRADDYAGRHASRSDSASRVLADEGFYAIRSGDSLSSIADSLGVEGGWSELYADNKDSIGADPDFIIPGQRIVVDS
ncbi:transglycosylase family protein [Streptomyces sp. CWNU-52B]|uniref:LysM peptidoglycan-binding domain-containing protein n=1 Tax=unclassified Streptomyces TaxID=2593676 RepID=UPI0039C08608